MTPHSLYIARLTLTDFRNHAALDLALDARPVCLFGPNGAGKTNILEALTMLAPGRGLRSASLVEVARADGSEARAQPWAVFARVMQDGEASTIGAGAERTPEGGVKRLARRDGQPATASELAEAARMTWLTPAMEPFLCGSPNFPTRASVN